MPNFLETIKRAALEAVNASCPVEVTYGEVVAVTPLTVQCGEKLRLSGKMLVFGRTAAASTYRTGEKLLLLRLQGGQQYLVLDKAVVT